MNILVLALNQYNFINEDTGEKIQGATIEYLTEEPTETDNRLGYFPLKQSLDLKELKNITSVPALYDVGLNMESGKNRKATVKFSNFSKVKDFDINKCFEV